MHELDIIIAQYFIILSLVGLLIAFLQTKRNQKKHFLIRLIASGLLAIVIALIARHFFYDTRPFVAGHFTPYFHHGADNGFVSDHTLLASLIACVVFIYRKWLGIVLFITTILIGGARVIAGVHHTIDIISAIVISIISTLVIYMVTEKMTKNKDVNHTS